MPAQNSQTSVSQTNLTHIYREVKQEEIFIDNRDYQVFVNFLKDCFCDTNKTENRKKTFTIRGNTYQGIAYQTQNFFGQIELIAYKLEPSRFDLVLKEIVPGSVEKFIRALSTRYVLYFNKKHNRIGSLFRDPYNLKKVNGAQDLGQLINNLYTDFSKKDGIANHYYSSYPEYLGQRITEWINSKEIDLSNGIKNQNLVTQENKPKTVNNNQVSVAKPKLRIPEMILASTTLFFFISYGLYNIEKSKIKSKSVISHIPPAISQVSGAKDEILVTPTQGLAVNQGAKITEGPEPSELKTVVIKIPEGAESVELRKLPSLESEVVSTANEGDKFELISVYPEWYEIKLDDSQNAFVPESYSEVISADI
jgi:hypothetical protein